MTSSALLVLNGTSLHSDNALLALTQEWNDCKWVLLQCTLKANLPPHPPPPRSSIVILLSLATTVEPRYHENYGVIIGFLYQGEKNKELEPAKLPVYKRVCYVCIQPVHNKVPLYHGYRWKSLSMIGCEAALPWWLLMVYRVPLKLSFVKLGPHQIAWQRSGFQYDVCTMSCVSTVLCQFSLPQIRYPVVEGHFCQDCACAEWILLWYVRQTRSGVHRHYTQTSQKFLILL